MKRYYWFVTFLGFDVLPFLHVSYREYNVDAFGMFNTLSAHEIFFCAHAGSNFIVRGTVTTESDRLGN